MKKISSVLLCLAGISILTACSNNTNSKNNSSKKSVVKVKKQQKYYFKNNVAEIHDLKIEITKVEVKNADQTNSYSDKPLIIFHYKVTNKTNKDIDPISAWQAVFTAYQDNDANSVNKLEIGSTIDEQYLDTQSEKIKKNGTVKNESTYELTDMKTPVKLQATKGYDGSKIGSQTYKIEQQQ
ncbi:DUF5067 domain-containing protein [Liquorilactobacillus satsumensis]|uniref:DUF5067 domain-containing protein n=1 Tax=Liquorilactobacillus satsumensis TaxID=259059 RepID=UPI00345D7EE2